MEPVYLHKDFNSQFPETFNWGAVDSIKLSGLADTLSGLCKNDLKTSDKNLVPGLRKALVEISKIATC